MGCERHYSDAQRTAPDGRKQNAKAHRLRAAEPSANDNTGGCYCSVLDVIIVRDGKREREKYGSIKNLQL